ncbi:MAG: NlpC/P60 family protein, partial [Brachybacterium sp.]|nr:NlpC/P60 family protein [Brachybacterium sp.]
AAAPVVILAPSAQAAPAAPPARQPLPTAPMGSATPTTAKVATTPVLPTVETASRVTQYVSARQGANVRSGPGTQHSVVGGRGYGAEVNGTWSNGWLNIGRGQFISGSILSEPAPTPEPPSEGRSVERWVNVPVANVRSGPGTNHRVVGTARNGEAITGTLASGWINMGNGRFISEGVVSDQAPRQETPEPPRQEEPAPSVRRWVDVPRANVRSGPGTDHPVVGSRAFGTALTGTLSNGWLQLSRNVFISETVLADSDPSGSRDRERPAPRPPAPQPPPAPAPPEEGTSAKRQAILATAAEHVGKPYVLYGTPPNSFDCSSYTWYVYQQNGITIPRTVRDQKAFVTRVTDPQPGDLIFYEDFYHVGLYSGPGMTYEALNPASGVRHGPLVNSNVWYGRVPGL